MINLEIKNKNYFKIFLLTPVFSKVLRSLYMKANKDNTT